MNSQEVISKCKPRPFGFASNLLPPVLELVQLVSCCRARIEGNAFLLTPA